MQPPYKVLIWALVVQISKSLRTPLSASSDVHIHAYRNISANTSISNGGDPVTPQWLETGDPCNGTATFELGKEYYEAECPAINQFLPDGTCDWAMKQTEDTNCSFFCQVRKLRLFPFIWWFQQPLSQRHWLPRLWALELIFS